MTSFIHRIEVHYKQDPRLKSRTDRIRSLGIPISELHLIDIYTIATGSQNFTKDELRRIGAQLINPVVQEYTVDTATMADFDYAIEVGFFPGSLIMSVQRQNRPSRIFSRSGLKKGNLSSSLTFLCLREPASGFAPETSVNACKSPRKPGPYQDIRGVRKQGAWIRLCRMSGYMNSRPQKPLTLISMTQTLQGLGKEGILDPITGQRRGPLALDLAQLHTIRDYFQKKAGSRQMWNSSRSPRRGASTANIRSLRHRWMTMSQKVSIKPTSRQPPTKSGRRKGRKISACTVFTDNSGAIIFDEHYLVTHKVETHNSPSALDPFGGALTGIVGVNRDTIGFGLGAKPCLNLLWVLCRRS